MFDFLKPPRDPIATRPSRITGSMQEWINWVNDLTRHERNELYPEMHISLIPAYEKISGMEEGDYPGKANLNPSTGVSTTSSWSSPLQKPAANYQFGATTPAPEINTANQTPSYLNSGETVNFTPYVPGPYQSPYTIQSLLATQPGNNQVSIDAKSANTPPSSIYTQSPTVLNAPTNRPFGLLDIDYAARAAEKSALLPIAATNTTFPTNFVSTKELAPNTPQPSASNTALKWPWTEDNPPDHEDIEEMTLEEIKEAYEMIADEGDRRGYHMAADNLRHFLNGNGAEKTIDPGWLLSWRSVTNAVAVNLGRFQSEDGNNPVYRAIRALGSNKSGRITDHWDRQIYSKPGSKLYYASGTSKLKSTGSFQLRADAAGSVAVSGNVDHDWSDEYSFEEGAFAVFKLGGRKYNLPDNAAIKLVNAGMAANFDMTSSWHEALNWHVQV